MLVCHVLMHYANTEQSAKLLHDSLQRWSSHAAWYEEEGGADLLPAC